MDPIQAIDLQDCPLCGGAGFLSDEGGFAFTVQCIDCGCQTAPAEYHGEAQRQKAAEAAAYCWNIGKVVYTGPGD